MFSVPTGTDDILFPDNAKALFGAGSDISVSWDGTDGHITTLGTLNIDGADGHEMATFVDGGAVTLFHNDSAKLATTSTGVDVTGSVVADGGDGGAKLGAWPQNSSYAFFGSANMTGTEYAIITDGTNTFVGSGTDGLTRIRGPANDSTPQIEVSSSTVSVNGGAFVFNEDSGDHDFRIESNSSTHAFFVDAGGEDICIGKSVAGLSTNGFQFTNITSTNTYLGLTNTSTSSGHPVIYANRQSGDGQAIQFRRANANEGNISVNTTGVTYNTTSDRRHGS